MEAGVQTRHVSLPGVELFLREAGEGDPVVLLHGWPQHGEVWRGLMAELARDHRVLVPDLRGFGRSEAPPGDYRKHTLVDDVLALLDAEGIERAAIVGHDWGGWIAWLLALEHPDRVERFAGLDIPAPWRTPLTPTRVARQLGFGWYQFVIASPLLGERLIRSSPKPVRAFIRGGTSNRRKLWTDAELDLYAESLREPARARASVALYRTFLLREVPKLARGTYTNAELRVPGLSIMGERSAVTRLIGAPEPGPMLTVELIDAGHYVVDEAPAEVLALLRGFLGVARQGTDAA